MRAFHLKLTLRLISVSTSALRRELLLLQKAACTPDLMRMQSVSMTLCLVIRLYIDTSGKPAHDSLKKNVGDTSEVFRTLGFSITSFFTAIFTFFLPFKK